MNVLKTINARRLSIIGFSFLFAQIAVRVWGCHMDYDNPENTALEGIKRLEEFWGSLGLPLNFRELGAKEEDIPFMVKNIGLKEGEHMGSFVPLYNEDIEKIYRLAL